VIAPFIYVMFNRWSTVVTFTVRSEFHHGMISFAARGSGWMSERSKERDSRPTHLHAFHKIMWDHSRVLCTRGFEPHFSQYFVRTTIVEYHIILWILNCERCLTFRHNIIYIILLDIISACPVDNKYAHDIIMLRAGIYVSSTYAPSSVSSCFN
jgi:hypothetical protein